jgi:hypothetical protein
MSRYSSSADVVQAWSKKADAVTAVRIECVNFMFSPFFAYVCVCAKQALIAEVFFLYQTTKFSTSAPPGISYRGLSGTMISGSLTTFLDMEPAAFAGA